MYFLYFTCNYYSFDVNNIHFTSVNSVINDTPKPNPFDKEYIKKFLSWLEND